ncbi:hypothetical protein [Comamonas antarctica]|uniref:Transmembrane protein n=1 Tax=Comamonas antarctica TaxID=2743470 RepID=A0A6N1X610_9BURK|nr:hypothetical protein [Comamonas antarctica]QKV54889.1 hypothetical protein HUK68_19420 [Comamonas antarctica]
MKQMVPPIDRLLSSRAPTKEPVTMPHPLMLRLLAIAVLLPSTLCAAFGTLLGVAWAADALQRGQHLGAAMALIAAIAAGWFGLVTAWRLYYQMLRRNVTLDRRIAWCGLASAALVCIGLMATTGGSLMVRIAFFGWPLLAAAFFGACLRIADQTERL